MDRDLAVVVDVDGTLVDSNYQHALAWHRAFRDHGAVIPVCEIHAHVGMGSDQIVPALVGEDAERRIGGAVRERHDALYMEVIDEVEPLPGARDLLQALCRLGGPVVLATSAKDPELDVYLGLLGARDLGIAWTSSADVDRTKPAPDLVSAALERAGRRHGVMIGDTPWDCEAARRAGVPTVAVLTGGFCEATLRAAGAREVHRSAAHLARAAGDLLDRAWALL